MKSWRQNAGLTLRDVATVYLNSEVTHTTLSRWEQSEKAIPQWAADIFLGTTKITLSVEELEQLLEYARQRDMSFNDVLADAIRDWLQRNDPAAAPAASEAPPVIDFPASKVAEPAKPYAGKPVE